jgi:hypothetical protein
MADQVDVLVFLFRVGGGAVSEMGVAHESDALHQVQRAVDRGDVDRRCSPLHLGADLLRGGVAQGADGVEDQLPLRGHP